MKEEFWKDVPNYEGLYQVSNLGRVKSLERKSTNKYGPQILKERMLIPWDNTHGRLQVYLCKNNKKIVKQIHRLVLETFVGACPDGMECCHNDDDYTNNSLENLRWDTHENNIKDKIRNCKTTIGEKDGMSKLKVSDVIKIKNILDEKLFSQNEIANLFNVGISTISRIKLNKSWRNIDAIRSMDEIK